MAMSPLTADRPCCVGEGGIDALLVHFPLRTVLVMRQREFVVVAAAQAGRASVHESRVCTE